MSCENCDGMAAAADSIAMDNYTLLEQVEALQSENAALKEASLWIPVEEGLPEDGDEILVWDGSSVWHATYEAGDFSCAITGDPLEGITHGMPLPRGPIAEQTPMDLSNKEMQA